MQDLWGQEHQWSHSLLYPQHHNRVWEAHSSSSINICWMNDESRIKLATGEKPDTEQHQGVLTIMCVPTSRFCFRAMIDVKRFFLVCEQVSRLDRGVWIVVEMQEIVSWWGQVLLGLGHTNPTAPEQEGNKWSQRYSVWGQPFGINNIISGQLGLSPKNRNGKTHLILHLLRLAKGWTKPLKKDIQESLLL